MKDWTGTEWLIFAIPFVIILAGVLIWLAGRRTIRTRTEMDRELRENKDISEWLVVFDWSSKVLYVPTIVFSVICFIMSLFASDSLMGTFGTIWLFLFLFNFIVEEFPIGLKETVIILLGMGALMTWLAYLHWLSPFIDFIGTLSVTMNGIGYLLIALVFLCAIFVSWLRGLFHYLAITPNYINIQSGLTETGMQITREHYSTSVNTDNLPQRIMGFGRVMVSFHDIKREPLDLLVWGIGRKSRKIETLRSVMNVENA